MPKTTSLAVVMDPIAKIKFAKDSTLAMLLAAAARGWQLTYFEQSDLFLRDGVALGRGRPLQGVRESREVVRARRALGAEVRRLRLRVHAQGSAVRRRVHLHHLHPRARGDPGRLRREPAPGPARHERKSVHRVVPAVLRADAHHAQRRRHHGVRRRARQDRRQTARRHGRQVHLRHRERRQEPAGHHRDADRHGPALRHRAALRARHRLHRAIRAC